MRLAYFSALEQYDPQTALKHAVEAEKAGFSLIGASDHFHPWVHRGGQAAFAWVWLASLAERTVRVRVGTCVTAPLLRYHPGLVAQAFATLGALYPGRIFLAVGAGEALNESPLGYPWPGRRERLERLEEAIRVIKLLWTSDFVDFQGKYYRLRKAKLYTKPGKPVPLYVSAGGLRMAELAGRLADGLITNMGAFARHGRKILEAFQAGWKGRAGEPFTSIVLHVSYHEDYEEALRAIRRWAPVLVPKVFQEDIYDPREVEAYGEKVSLERLEAVHVVASEPEQIIRRIENLEKQGFTCVFLSNSSPQPEKFLEVCRRQILPYFEEERGKGRP